MSQVTRGGEVQARVKNGWDEACGMPRREESSRPSSVSWAWEKKWYFRDLNSGCTMWDKSWWNKAEEFSRISTTERLGLDPDSSRKSWQSFMKGK